MNNIIDYNASLLSNLANLSSYLMKTLKDVSWVGFYLNHDEKLILGPFQGNPACTLIKDYNGVCGECLKTKKTQIIKNVHEFKTHIACDAGSNSELVIPVMLGEKVIMVLDIDSYSLNRFNEYNDEVKELESICNELTNYIELNGLELIK